MTREPEYKRKLYLKRQGERKFFLDQDYKDKGLALVKNKKKIKSRFMNGRKNNNNSRLNGFLDTNLKTYHGLVGAIKAISDDEKDIMDFTGQIPNGRVYTYLEYVSLCKSAGQSFSMQEMFSMTTQDLMMESSKLRIKLNYDN